MMSGVAVGGPRNGIKLIAPLMWDGKVRKPAKRDISRAALELFPGNYYWDAEKETWIWHEWNETELKQNGVYARRYGAYHVK